MSDDVAEDQRASAAVSAVVSTSTSAPRSLAARQQAVRDLLTERPANTNASQFVETWPVGDPDSFARVLARILVRRALIEAGMIPDDQRCEK